MLKRCCQVVNLQNSLLSKSQFSKTCRSYHNKNVKLNILFLEDCDLLYQRVLKTRCRDVALQNKLLSKSKFSQTCRRYNNKNVNLNILLLKTFSSDTSTVLYACDVGLLWLLFSVVGTTAANCRYSYSFLCAISVVLCPLCAVFLEFLSITE